jgi:hypothetical protein
LTAPELKVFYPCNSGLNGRPNPLIFLDEVGPVPLAHTGALFVPPRGIFPTYSIPSEEEPKRGASLAAQKGHSCLTLPHRGAQSISISSAAFDTLFLTESEREG